MGQPALLLVVRSRVRSLCASLSGFGFYLGLRVRCGTTPSFWSFAHKFALSALRYRASVSTSASASAPARLPASGRSLTSSLSLRFATGLRFQPRPSLALRHDSQLLPGSRHWCQTRVSRVPAVLSSDPSSDTWSDPAGFTSLLRSGSRTLARVSHHAERYLV